MFFYLKIKKVFFLFLPSLIKLKSHGFKHCLSSDSNVVEPKELKNCVL